MAYGGHLFSSEESVELKKTIAQILYDHDVEQSKISSILGLSQSMVSNYCSAKKPIHKEIIELARSITERICKGEQIQFQQCVIFSEVPLQGSWYIADKNELIDDENRPVIDNLMNAFMRLKNRNLQGFIPKVKINIAKAKPQASRPEDVAAFVNGFVVADDSIIGNNGIRFGCSSHLSTLLLYLQRKLDIHAIMNIAYLERMPVHSFTSMYLDRDFQLKLNDGNVDLLFHKGDFGIEPCTYIVGSDAVDVTSKLIRLLEGDTL